MTALLGLTEHTPALWISAAISEAEEEMSRVAGGRSFPMPDLGVDTRGRFVTIDAETYHDYYNVVANPMLWFIQHYLWDLSNAPDIRHEELMAWEHGYLAANRAFAGRIGYYPNRIFKNGFYLFFIFYNGYNSSTYQYLNIYIQKY